MNFKSLDMESKKIFDQFLTPYPFIVSTYNFTNLFMWRNAQNIRYHHTDHALFIMKEKDQPFFIPPVVKDKEHGREAYESLLSYMNENGMTKILRDVTKTELDELIKRGY